MKIMLAKGTVHGNKKPFYVEMKVYIYIYISVTIVYIRSQ